MSTLLEVTSAETLAGEILQGSELSARNFTEAKAPVGRIADNLSALIGLVVVALILGLNFYFLMRYLL